MGIIYSKRIINFNHFNCSESQITNHRMKVESSSLHLHLSYLSPFDRTCSKLDDLTFPSPKKSFHLRGQCHGSNGRWTLSRSGCRQAAELEEWSGCLQNESPFNPSVSKGSSHLKVCRILKMLKTSFLGKLGSLDICL